MANGGEQAEFLRKLQYPSVMQLNKLKSGKTVISNLTMCYVFTSTSNQLVLQPVVSIQLSKASKEKSKSNVMSFLEQITEDSLCDNNKQLAKASRVSGII